MKNLIVSLTLLMTPLISSANDAPILACDRQAIRHAIEVGQREILSTNFQVKPRQGLKEKGLRPDLLAIEAIEKNVFGKKVFNLRYDVVAGASISTNNIAIYEDTIKELNTLVPGSDKNSSDAHMFIMAHEMGHMMQSYWKKNNPSGLSPMGLVDSQDSSSDQFNLLHAETDCIGVELMRMAGQKDFSTVVESIHLITKDCKQFRTEEFCDRADAIRSRSVQLYLEQ